MIRWRDLFYILTGDPRGNIGNHKMRGLCPHCDEVLELDISFIDWAKRPDDEFECPHCGGEFSFNTWKKWRGLKSEIKWIFGGK